MSIDLFILALVNILAVWIIQYFFQKATNSANLEDIKELTRQSKLGENAASKEDIAEITQKIETVRNELAEFSSRKQDKFIQFRTAIVDYSNDLTNIVDWKFKTIPIGEDVFIPNAIKSDFIDFSSHWAKTSCSYQRIILYADKNDRKFVMEIYSTFQSILAQYKITIQYYDILLRYSSLVQLGGSEKENAIQEIISGQKKYYSKINEIENETFNAFSSIQQLLQKKLEEKYDFK